MQKYGTIVKVLCINLLKKASFVVLLLQLGLVQFSMVIPSVHDKVYG